MIGLEGTLMLFPLLSDGVHCTVVFVCVVNVYDGEGSLAGADGDGCNISRLNAYLYNGL